MTNMLSRIALALIVLVAALGAPQNIAAAQDGSFYNYTTQPGDTIASLAFRFGVEQSVLAEYPQAFNDYGMTTPGAQLSIPWSDEDGVNQLTTLIPDSEAFYSPDASTNFSVVDFVGQYPGSYLALSREYVESQFRDGYEIIQHVANKNAVNPRILLAILEYKTLAVTQDDQLVVLKDPFETRIEVHADHLFEQLQHAMVLFLEGYYGWKEGYINTVQLRDGNVVRIHPATNAGSFAILYFTARFSTMDTWDQNIDKLMSTYTGFFGDPFQYEIKETQYVTANTIQPDLLFPFDTNETWSLTASLHQSWGIGSPWGALDFAPTANEPGCAAVSYSNVLAAANGVVVRAEDNALALDLDADGDENTGWVVFYYHIPLEDRATVGTTVQAGDVVGHPSCSGGSSTGVHIHVARKFNGEWVSGVSGTPFVIEGWNAYSSGEIYEGYLIKGLFRIDASAYSVAFSQIDTAVKREQIHADILSLRGNNVLPDALTTWLEGQASNLD